MNIKQQLSTLAISLLLAGCTAENVVPAPEPGGGDVTTDPNRREVMLTLKNKLNITPVTTKADVPIASDEENYIRSLDVYVFASDKEDGTYTFQELYYYRDDASTVTGDGDWAHSFNINPVAGKDNESSGLLRLQKGLYIKMYCIANRTTLYQTDAGGAVTLYENFAGLKQSAPGQPGNTLIPGVPTEDDFKLLHSPVINPAGTTEDDVLVTPLPMVGSYITPLDLTDFSVSTRTQLSFKLSRLVARFDVVNKAEESKFTITSISMGNGQNGSTLFPAKPLITDNTKLVTYPVRAIGSGTQTTVDDKYTTEGAFYTWPSAKDNEGYLILKGKYQVNKLESMDVSYQVPFQQIKDGVGSYIEVSGNHRYTIAITKADTYHLDFTLNVADWDDQGKTDYTPENDFDTHSKVVLLTDAGATAGAYVQPSGAVSISPVDGSKFAFQIGSSTTLTEELIYKSGSAKWLVKDPDGRTKAAPLSSPAIETKYAYKVDKDQLTDQGDILAITIRLTNPASGDHKDIVVKPFAAPVISWTTDPGSFSSYDPKSHTATLYNVVGQDITLTATADAKQEGETITSGSTAAESGGPTAWLTISPGSSVDAVTAYTLSVGSGGTARNTATVNFTSTLTSKSTPVTAKLKDPALKELTDSNFASVTGNTDNTFQDASTTGSNAKVTMANAAENNSFRLTVTSPEGISASTADATDWMTVTTSNRQASSSGDSYTNIVTVTLKAIDADKTGTITLANAIAGGNNLTVDVAANIPVVVEP